MRGLEYSTPLGKYLFISNTVYYLELQSISPVITEG